jgi:hypothetical protein
MVERHAVTYQVLQNPSQIYINSFIILVLDYRLSRDDIGNLYSSLTNEAGVLYFRFL